MTEPTDRWFVEHNIVVSVGRWAMDEGHLSDAAEMLSYFEKPWKYTSLYDEWRRTEGSGSLDLPSTRDPDVDSARNAEERIGIGGGKPPTTGFDSQGGRILPGTVTKKK